MPSTDIYSISVYGTCVLMWMVYEVLSRMGQSTHAIHLQQVKTRRPSSPCTIMLMHTHTKTYVSTRVRRGQHIFEQNTCLTYSRHVTKKRQKHAWQPIIKLVVAIGNMLTVSPFCVTLRVQWHDAQDTPVYNCTRIYTDATACACMYARVHSC